MALADKKYERIFSITGNDDDKIDNERFDRIKSKFDNKEYLKNNDSFETLAPIIYQMQLITEELDELRRFLKEETN